MMKDTFQFTK